jgi:hypothetical protein
MVRRHHLHLSKCEPVLVLNSPFSVYSRFRSSNIFCKRDYCELFLSLEIQLVVGALELHELSMVSLFYYPAISNDQDNISVLNG